jgi:miniconductance mechanosensitive channel
MIFVLRNWISAKLSLLFGEFSWLYTISFATVFVLIGILAIIAFYLFRVLASKFIEEPLKNSHIISLQVIAKSKILGLLAHLISGFIFFVGSLIIIEQDNRPSEFLAVALEKISLLYIFITLLFVISRFIWLLNTYYNKKFVSAKQYPIYSYLKVLILFIWIIGLILIICYFFNTSPWALLTGVGAVSALFLLVFKDTLLGIIASVQVTALNIVHIGDRISIDKYNIDGIVLDISISIVKVRNHDGTVANLPTYMLTTEVVKNWHFIEDGGIRRIKRSIHIDIMTIEDVKEQLVNSLLTSAEIVKYIGNNISKDTTNLTLYRTYLQKYLESYPALNKETFILVRHLDPTPTGLPLEIYTYVPNVSFFDFEQIQADIFEHAITMLPKFNLKIFQVGHYKVT